MAEAGAPKTSGQKNHGTQRRKGRSQVMSRCFLQHSRIPCSDQLPVAIQQNSTLSLSFPLQLNTVHLQVPLLSLPLLFSQRPDGSFPNTQGPTLKPNPHPGLAAVSHFHLCESRVSICHGCSQSIRIAEALVSPPAGLVVVSKMLSEYTVAGGRRQGKMENVYFHANLPCIKNTLAHFLPSLLTV